MINTAQMTESDIVVLQSWTGSQEDVTVSNQGQIGCSNRPEIHSINVFSVLSSRVSFETMTELQSTCQVSGLYTHIGAIFD